MTSPRAKKLAKKRKKTKVVRAWALIGCDDYLYVETCTRRKPPVIAPFGKEWAKLNVRYVRVVITQEGT